MHFPINDIKSVFKCIVIIQVNTLNENEKKKKISFSFKFWVKGMLKILE